MTQATQSLDQVTSFSFGPTGKQLFGLYHAPLAGYRHDIGVVLCNPWGQEFIRAHRALSQLGLRLARQGFPVLRFDYYGSGDSNGEDNDGTLTQWQNDIRLAIHELKRRARIDTVILTGLRLGASLAAIVASGRDDVDGLVLWEPIINGDHYIQELIRWQEEKSFYFLAGVNLSSSSNQPRELLGFELGSTFLAELQSLDLLTINRKPADQILVIESQNNPATENCKSYFHDLGAQVDYQFIESFLMWTEDPDKGLVPQPIIQAILTWVMQAAI